jgi:hypothetical protein
VRFAMCRKLYEGYALLSDVNVIEFTIQTPIYSTLLDVPSLPAYQPHKNKNNKYNLLVVFISFSFRSYVKLEHEDLCGSGDIPQ